MDIEIKLDKKYTNPKIIIYAEKLDENLSCIIDNISKLNQQIIKAYKDGKLYILLQNDIETIYSQNGRVYIRCNNELYTVKDRLYKLENMLNNKIFIRISNSEIVNFEKVKNIDFKIIGTLIINFKSGNKAYASRRYIPKIKKILEI